MNIIGECLIVAEKVLRDHGSNLLSLIQCLEVVAAVRFPSQHPGFAIAARYRIDGTAPTADVNVDFQVVRCSALDGEEVIAEFPGTWRAGSTRARIATNFQFLRLIRAERLIFRIDHRVGGGPWVPGPSCALDVELAELTPEQVESLRAEAARLGLPPPL